MTKNISRNFTNKLLKTVPTISLFAFVFVATTAHSFAALSLFNNSIVSHVEGNCYYRAEENPYFNQTTYNQVCNPRIYEIDTANQNQNYYTSNYSFSQPTQSYQQSYSYVQPTSYYYPQTTSQYYTSGYSYSQPVAYDNSYSSNYNYGNTGYYTGNNSYQGDQNYTNYLDFPYYGSVQNYTPTLDAINASPYYSGYTGDYTGYNNGNYYDNYYDGQNQQTYYGTNASVSNGCNYDNYGQYYCY